MAENIDYKKINHFLNAYCSSMDKSYFLENSIILYTLTLALYEKLAGSIINSENAKTFLEKDKQYLTLIETLDIVEKYIDCKLPMYEDRYNKSLASGIIDIVDEDDEEDLDKENYATIDDDGHHIVHISLTHTINDPSILIHEFLHELNSCEKERKSRRYIGEAISIYFEMDFNKFLIEQGFNKEEVVSLLLARVKESYRASFDALEDFSFLHYFYNIGEISENTFQDLLNFDIRPRPRKKETFNETLISFQKLIEKKPDYNPLRTYSYVIGTIIALYGIDQGEDFRQKMLELNDLANCGDVTKIFNHIGINIYNDKSMQKLNEGLDKGLNIIENTITKRSSKEK